MRSLRVDIPLGLLVLAMACAPTPDGEVGSTTKGSTAGGSTMGEAAAGGSSRPLVVYTVNYPLAYFAERIGGDRVEVSLPVPSDVDPAVWSPDLEAIEGYQAADLVLLNGADYAGWVSKVSLPESKLVDTSAGITDGFIQLDDTVTHSHGPEGEHTHTGWAFTLWLDPQRALAQARVIRDALIEARPEGEPDFQAGFESLQSDLDDLDDSLGGAFDALGSEPMLFSHPVYQYLEDRYGLDARSLHWEPDQMPAEGDWSHLAEMLDADPAVAMLWEGEPLPDVRRRLEEMGLEVLVFDPAANRPQRDDWLAIMRANADRLSSLADRIGR